MSHVDEDETEVDVLLFAPTGDEALTDAFDRGERFQLTVVNDADVALDRIRSGEFPPPQLLLMEFDGGSDSVELLQTVKDDEMLRRIPVERPSDPDGFDEVVDRIESFWVRAATLPPLTNDS
jgi:hypothetical protein